MSTQQQYGDAFKWLEELTKAVGAKPASYRTVKVMWRTKGKAKYRIGLKGKRDVVVETLSMMERD